MRSNPVTIRTEFKSSWLNGKLWLLRFYIHSLWPVVILIPSVKFHISSLCARAHLCFHDSDAREWDECRGRRRQGLPVLQWDSRGVRLLQQTGGLPRGPCLQGERVHRAYTYFRCSCISQKDNNVKTAFPLFCSLSPFRWLIVHPVCFVFCTCQCGIMVSVCGHRGILEVRGPCRRNGHPSWRPEWIVQYSSLNCRTLFRTLTAGVTPNRAGRTVCSTPSSHHSRTFELSNVFVLEGGGSLSL